MDYWHTDFISHTHDVLRKLIGGKGNPKSRLLESSKEIILCLGAPISDKSFDERRDKIFQNLNSQPEVFLPNGKRIYSSFQETVFNMTNPEALKCILEIFDFISEVQRNEISELQIRAMK